MTKPALTRAALPPALQRALDLAVDAKAAAPVVLQLTDVAGYTDWALVVSGRSDRHVGGITEAIMAGLKDMQTTPIGTDGLEEHLWDLLDYDDFLIHVFYHPVRKHYDLESMWRDAPRAELGLPPEVMDTSTLEGLAPPVDMPPFRGGSFGAFPGELEDEEELAGAPGELPEGGDDEGEDLDEGEEGDVAEYDEPDDFADDEEGDYAYGDEDDEDDEDLAADDDAGEAVPAEAPPPARRK
ncbi:Ribosomal silencing factor during starvation [Nannocystis exedens]|uniref:Ribosomal silencing factor RsfS n=1 Tax=Nannocystis exedens TaxID=54 RepID=A0A1I2GA28_9BACT|nr:ribosome silencing factor [Nannocystis exedens]PCC67353.1 iojap protein family [Nannocystis exedens]SFF13797.1 Ribosomal silencing factor during starvation [Nannocystis exedens]